MKKLFLFAFVFTLCGHVFAQETANWAQTAASDLDYMYQMYRDNHAGGVDPNNPGFNKKLEKEYKKFIKKTEKVKTEKEYQQVLKDFLKSFDDSHMMVFFGNVIAAEPPTAMPEFSRPPLSLELFNNDKAAWVDAHSFIEKENVFEQFSKQLAGVRDKDIIVLDLRYNIGGNPYNAAFLLEGLYGKEYADYINQQTRSKQQLYLRVTPWAARSLEKTVQFFDMPPSAEMSVWLAKLKEALEKGEKVFFVEHKNIYPARPNNLNARVYFLTDKHCNSACLMFLDTIKEIGNIPQLGEKTDFDTVYMHSWQEPLPSGRGEFVISYVGYSKRQRKSNEPYEPDYKYNGDMGDTKAIQEWVINLDKKIHKK